MEKKYPTTRQILYLAGVGAFIASSLIFPNLHKMLGGKRIDFESLLFEDEWEGFDEPRLRQRLKELHKQKVVRIYQHKDKYLVQITKKGRKRLLQYKLEDLEIPKPSSWDRRWRIVAYDIPKEKKSARDALRTTLKRLGFFALQESVYLYPYPCNDAIEFIREIYNVGEHVTLLTVGYLEDEEVYRKYFEL